MSTTPVQGTPLSPQEVEQRAAQNFNFLQYQKEHGIAQDSRYQTEDVQWDDSTFQSMGLSLPVLKGIADCGFILPSPIQGMAIPKLLSHFDVIARAKNGTGKTAAFCIPIVQRIDTTKNHVQAVIVASTRELVIQIGEFLRKLTNHLPIKILSSYGGTVFQNDILALKQGVHILIATSGRLETIAEKHFLNQLKICVVDEADKMCAGNGGPQFVEKLFTSILPPKTQKALFSATFPHEMENVIQQHIPTAHFVNAMDDITLRGVTQHYLVVEEAKKLKALKQLLSLLKINQCIIFCSSPQRVEAVAHRMSTQWQIPCFAIHGNYSQDDRSRITQQFNNGAFKFLVATDIMSRGYNNQGINVVINFDLTSSPETYLHRIGRSGRWGHLGLAINLVNTDPTSASIIQQYEEKLGTQITQLPQVIDHQVYAHESAQTTSTASTTNTTPTASTTTTASNTSTATTTPATSPK